MATLLEIHGARILSSCKNFLSGCGSSALLLLILVTGCSKGFGEVSGKVLYNGQPLTTGFVAFFCQDGQVATGAIQKDGSYTILGAPAGPVKITVESRPPSPYIVGKTLEQAQKDAASGKTMPTERPKVSRPKYVKIPENFNDAKKSGLTYTVYRGPQNHDIVLEP